MWQSESRPRRHPFECVARTRWRPAARGVGSARRPVHPLRGRLVGSPRCELSARGIAGDAVKPCLVFFTRRCRWAMTVFPEIAVRICLSWGTSSACGSMRSSMPRTSRCSAAMESVARSIGLRGPSFLPNAVGWAAVHWGRHRSPAGIVCRPPTYHSPGRADLAGRRCRRATAPRKLLSLLPGHRPSGGSRCRVPGNRNWNLWLSTSGSRPHCRRYRGRTLGPTAVPRAGDVCLFRRAHARCLPGCAGANT